MKGSRRLISLFLLLGVLLVEAVVAHGEKQNHIDGVGRTVTFSYPPRRIVSLAPDITETLFALGLDDEIVGVTRFSNFPPAARRKRKVGSYVEVNMEAIIGLQPDLILATGAGNSPMQINKLERMGYSVFVVYPKNLDEVLATIQTIGKIVGKESEGIVIARKMKQRIEEISQKAASRKKPKVLLQIGRDPIITVSKGSFAHDLISLGGGDNIAKDARRPYPSYALEEIILMAPEVIIISSMYLDSNHLHWIEEWKKWRILPAVKNNRLYTISSDIIDRPSPRIVQGLEQMARLIHPEVFTGQEFMRKKKPITNPQMLSSSPKGKDIANQ